MKCKNLTLDAAQDAFERRPNLFWTASEYRRVALEYWNAGMIGDATLLAVLNATLPVYQRVAQANDRIPKSPRVA